MKALSFSDLPFNRAVCHQTDCPLAARCLRMHGGSVLPLSQQAAIAEIFHRLGLKGEPQFDHYETRYHFPEP